MSPAKSLLAAAALLAPLAAQAQLFHLYLACKGTLEAGRKSRPAALDLALRDNNQTALIQRSDVLPVGDRVSYVPSQTHYAMVHHTRAYSGAVVGNWWHTMVVWYPALERWKTTRLSIDRNSGELEGEMLSGNQEKLARFTMKCEPTKQDEAPLPRF